MAGDFGQENRLSANDGLTIDQQLTADRGKNERRPDQMMQPGGDQEPVEKAVQEDPDGAKGFAIKPVSAEMPSSTTGQR